MVGTAGPGGSTPVAFTEAEILQTARDPRPRSLVTVYVMERNDEPAADNP